MESSGRFGVENARRAGIARGFCILRAAIFGMTSGWHEHRDATGSEHLKERDPAAFGRLLGLDRAPEVKTLRRRLTRLAAHHCAEQLGAELARLRVDQRGHLMGFLYVDGHVRAYHGQRAVSSKAYVARRHLAMPASTDYWINDRSGDPLLVITGEVDAALTKALPRLLREVREVVGERRVTIVFDRGGWSPKLFGTMIKDGFDLLTYRKGRCRRINERRFIRRRAQLDGRWVDYLLHDQPVGFLKGKLRLRQVTRLCDGGHQTQVITSSMGPARHRGRLPHVLDLDATDDPLHGQQEGRFFHGYYDCYCSHRLHYAQRLFRSGARSRLTDKVPSVYS